MHSHSLTISKTPSAQDLLPLKVIERGAWIYVLIALVVSIFFWPSLSVISGLLIGCMISILNFRVIRLVSAKMLSNAASHGVNYSFFFVLKIIFLLAVTGFLFLQVRMNTLAFMAGFAAIIFGIFFEAVYSCFRSHEGKYHA